MTIKEGDEVRVKKTARRCSGKVGQVGTIIRIRYTNGPAEPIYFVKFIDNKTELFKEKDLEILLNK